MSNEKITPAAPEHDPEISRRLVQLANKLMDEAGIGELQVPDGLLYHYTTPMGLMGILEHKNLWATNSDYLNDTSELSYGRIMAV